MSAASTLEPSLLLTHLAGPENCTPALSGTTATGAEAFVARSGPPPSLLALRPPARTLGTRLRPVGPGRGGLVRTPSAALRFCGVLAAALSHDNELASAEGPRGRSAWRPAQAAAWRGGAGVGDGERGRRSLASRYLRSPPPTEAFL